MRLLRATFISDYKTLSSWGERLGGINLDTVDLGGLTVIYGANGAGKTNALEAIGGILEDTTGSYTLRSGLRIERGLPVEESNRIPYGLLSIQFDRGLDSAAPESEVLRTLLTHPAMGDILLDRDLAEEMADQIPTAREGNEAAGAPSAGEAIEMWAEALAVCGSIGSYEDRKGLSRAVLRQAIFQFPDGFPMVDSMQLPRAAREAAARITASAPPGTRYWDDPVFDLATQAQSDILAPFREAYLVSSYYEVGREVWDMLAPLLCRVAVLDGSTATIDEEVGRAAEALAERAVLAAACDEIEAKGKALALIEWLANEHAPAFVGRNGRLELRDEEGRVSASFREAGESCWSLDALGAGVSRWGAIAIRTATQEALTYVVQRRGGVLDFVPPPPGHYPALCLVDEPEAHLHPRAIRDVAEWLVRQHRDGAGVVVATHALEFLDLQSETAMLMLAARGEGGLTVLTPMEGDLLQTLRAHAEELGLSESQVLRLARGVVVVEGKQDEDLFRHYFGRELQRDRLIVLSLYGAGNVPALVEVDFLKLLGVPVGVLLDGRPRLAEAMGKQHGVHVELLGLPDILCCLPDEATAAVLERRFGASFPGWAALVRDYERPGAPRVGFKAFLTKRLNLPKEARELLDRSFIHQVLQTSDGAEPEPHLARAVSALIAALTSARS